MTPQRQKEIETLLKSRHSDVVLDTLDLIRKEGNSNLILPMVQLLNDTDSQEVIESVLSILRFVKTQDAVPKLVEAIADPDSFLNRSVLVAACWESGLNFDAHLNFFVDLALSENYLVCLECITLIENTGNDIPEADLLANWSKVKKHIQPSEDKKDELLVALLAVLDEKRKLSLQN